VSPVDPDAGAKSPIGFSATKKNGRTFSGCKAPIGTDQGSDLIRRAIMTTGSIHDSQAGDALIQGDQGAVPPGLSRADQARDDDARRARLEAAGIKARILYKARRSKPLRPWKKAFNKAAAAIRASVERPCAAMFARCRALGLARVEPTCSWSPAPTTSRQPWACSDETSCVDQWRW
jgi:IS5 family transposase